MITSTQHYFSFNSALFHIVNYYCNWCDSSVCTIMHLRKKKLLNADCFKFLNVFKWMESVWSKYTFWTFLGYCCTFGPSKVPAKGHGTRNIRGPEITMFRAMSQFPPKYQQLALCCLVWINLPLYCTSPPICPPCTLHSASKSGKYQTGIALLVMLVAPPWKSKKKF